MAIRKSTAENIEPVIDPVAEPLSIPKPRAFSMAAFKTKSAPTIAGVETLLAALPHHKISEAKDWVRLHPDETKYCSDELCFVNVPIVGVRNTLHVILEDLAKAHLPSGRYQRFRLALATKPEAGKFFLCHVPTQNLDNAYNNAAKQGCESAKKLWTQVSRREDGVEGYQVQFSRDPDAFPEPEWPKQDLEALINVSFTDRLIMSESDPALLRLIGAKQADE